MLSSLIDTFKPRLRSQIANYTYKILELKRDQLPYADYRYKVELMIAALDFVEGDITPYTEKQVEGLIHCISAQCRLSEVPNSTFTILTTDFEIIDDLAALKGEDGEDGTNGASAYFYIRFATNSSGAGISASPGGGRNFVAWLTTTTPLADPNNASNYTGLWVNYVGANGSNGANGTNGVNALVFIRYAEADDGTGISDAPSPSRPYIGLWATTQAVIDAGGNPDDPANYTFVEYLGADGASAYVYIAYADDNVGTGFTTTTSTTKEFIAIKTTTSPIVSPSASDFTGLWYNRKGVAGATGPAGPTGATGPAATIYSTITHADLLTAIGAGTLEEGRHYAITSRPEEGNGTTGLVIVVATSDSSVSRYGTLIARVPDYGTVAIWENTSLASGQTRIWNGKTWTSNTTTTSEPGADATWDVVEAGGFLEVDYIEYDAATDHILRRKDKRGNDISASLEGITVDLGANPIDLFQWGNNNKQANVAHDAIIRNINHRGSWQACRAINQGEISSSQVNSNITATQTILNVSANGADVDIQALATSSTVSNIETKGNITINISSGNVTGVLNNTGITIPITAALSNKRLDYGYSDFEATLDVGTSSTANLTGLSYVGILNLTCTNSTQTITEISNMPTNHPVEIRPASGKTITFDDGPVNIKNFGATDIALDGSAFEWVVYRLRGSRVEMINKGEY